MVSLAEKLASNITFDDFKKAKDLKRRILFTLFILYDQQILFPLAFILNFNPSISAALLHISIRCRNISK